MTLKEINFWNWLVSVLPVKLVYFCYMRVWTEATTEENKGRNPDTVLCKTSLTLFRKKYNITF